MTEDKAQCRQRAAKELRSLRRKVFAEYVQRYGRIPSRAACNEILCAYWYRLSDEALSMLYRSKDVKRWRKQ